jgi:hypothetical protein
MSAPHPTSESKRSAKSIVLQWATVVVFFLPIWLVYAALVAPSVRPETRVSLDIGVPMAAFVLCAALSFAYRAHRRARRTRLLQTP